MANPKNVTRVPISETPKQRVSDRIMDLRVINMILVIFLVLGFASSGVIYVSILRTVTSLEKEVQQVTQAHSNFEKVTSLSLAKINADSPEEATRLTESKITLKNFETLVTDLNIIKAQLTRLTENLNSLERTTEYLQKREPAKKTSPNK